MSSKFTRIILRILGIFGFALFLFFCKYSFEQFEQRFADTALKTEKPPGQKTDGIYHPVMLDDILEAGKITVITKNSANCYYLYKNKPMGFEYDLAKAFADYLGVSLDVQTANDLTQMSADIAKGKGAFIAAGLTTDAESAGSSVLNFSTGYMAVEPLIIVHRDNRSVTKVEDFKSHPVHVRQGSPYQAVLEDLKNQGIDLDIRLHEKMNEEELIRQVSEKQIEATIANTHIALLNRRYYPKIDIRSSVGQRQFLVWAVSPESKELMVKIESFFRTIQQNGTFDRLYARYYAAVDFFDYNEIRAFYRYIENRLPDYAMLIEKAAEKHDLDWRMIAAQMYQESRFSPDARSNAGAAGLMQLLPETAKDLGVTDIYDVKENINAGVRHMKKLYDFFDKAKGIDRLCIALGAYNAGQGHILDARNLARDRKLNPDKWESLEKILPLLEEEAFYKDTIYGYCRGTEPVDYVRQIMIYYDILKRDDIEYVTAKSEP